MTETQMRITKNGQVIESLDAWRERAGPKSRDQWVSGRSAMETARAWLEGGPAGLPPEVHAILESSQHFGPPSHWRAEPEVKLRFDDFRGETRNSDLVVWASDRWGPYVIGVEAKADESFSQTVAEALNAALERAIANPNSRGVPRIEQLVCSLLPPSVVGVPDIASLRYQLLTACAGVLAEAARSDCSRAVMLVHEFITPKTSDARHAANARDLERFVSRLSRGADDSISVGQLQGPYVVPGMPLFESPPALFIGKVQRNLREGLGSRA